ncbi:hypothetical protein BDV37DRAFT_246543 [Aspergillus pseudonomiae]|uniref:Uncharacterized protein n=1 Tax=Aspergillus pseudonomiae TaxID=1506151 RepID=A0A5N7DF68_9EURO|nr:uncharacterized protein BDV37DRAFT_246543 [Aspergillus pseudonomiae]KAE8404904.1 hypothetical protein BDV37DRAFT_246543 [Aspergillus pseudonomiae]
MRSSDQDVSPSITTSASDLRAASHAPAGEMTRAQEKGVGILSFPESLTLSTFPTHSRG